MTDLHAVLRRRDSFSGRIIDIRREIHRRPETGFGEFETARIVERELRSLGLEVRMGIAGTGVVGILRGTGVPEGAEEPPEVSVDITGGARGRKAMLLRADMDCLEIDEKAAVPFCSEIAGRMHACGHDAHTAWVLGAAMILAGMRETMRGDVVFLFQPAEETTGGAAPMIAEGVLDDPSVTAAIAAHIDPSPCNRAGMATVRYGTMCAAADNFHLVIRGPGGHNSAPHLAPDPISVAVQIYLAFKALIERGTDPLEPAVLHVGTFRSGMSHNTIPDSAELTGTVRTLNEKIRLFLETRMREIAREICLFWKVTCEFEYRRVYPPLVNDKGITDIVRTAAAGVLGCENVMILEKPEMTGEDFSFFQERVPGTYINIGTYNPDIGAVHPLHSPSFTIDETVIPSAAAILAAAALSYLQQPDSAE